MSKEKDKSIKFTKTIPKFLQQYSSLLTINKNNYMNEEIGYQSNDDEDYNLQSNEKNNYINEMKDNFMNKSSDDSKDNIEEKEVNIIKDERTVEEIFKSKAETIDYNSSKKDKDNNEIYDPIDNNSIKFIKKSNDNKRKVINNVHSNDSTNKRKNKISLSFSDDI